MNVRALVAAVVVMGGTFLATLLVITLAPTGGRGFLGSASITLSATLVGAGDVAGCDANSDSATAAILDKVPGTVFTLGDNAYPGGTAAEFRECYAPTWGRHLHRTRPAVGSHDYGTPGAAAYWDYFGDAAGARGKGWYAYDAGAWHVVVLNSQCGELPDRCAADSEQLLWLRDHLAATPSRCLLGYWHSPRWSSGSEHGAEDEVQTFWDLLAPAGADVVLNGDDHHYERFAPLDVAGRPAPDGIRQFVVGTGGAGLRPIATVQPNSEFRLADRHGVLRLDLHPAGYRWSFLAEPDGTALDTGEGTCG